MQHQFVRPRPTPGPERATPVQDHGSDPLMVFSILLCIKLFQHTELGEVEEFILNLSSP
jgi:hypothetical protein